MTASIEDYGLGRRHEADERDSNYRAVSLLSGTVLPILSRYWPMQPALNQQRTSMCVDYSLETCLMGSPGMYKAPLVPLGTIYKLAQTLDDTPGEDYNGTSVRAGNKAAVQLNLIKEYRWMLTTSEILTMLSWYGPVVMGTNWYESMFHPDSNGMLSISGAVAGGHAYCLCGIDVYRKRVRKLGSWGAEWGQNGRAWITWDALDRLLGEQGEASLPVQH